jgi:hypothetical protein
MEVYNDFPAEKLSAGQTHDIASRRVVDWHKSHTLAEALAIVASMGHASKDQQFAPEGFHFVLSTTLGYFPHHLVPFKPVPSPSLRLARRFDNILLAVSHGEFWVNYLPENIAKTIVIRLVPAIN